MPLHFSPEGGLNLSQPPHAIAENELVSAYNYYFAPETGVLTTRPPFRCYSSNPVPGTGAKGILNIHAFQEFLICSSEDGNLYAYDLRIGEATFQTFILLRPIANAGIFLNFNKSLLWVDGTGLYKWDGVTTTIAITTLLDSASTPAITPTALAEVNSRVIINNTTDAPGEKDAVYLSAPEDETSWNTGGSGATAVGLRAGYGDGMEVNGLAVLGKDVIISKTGLGKRFMYRVNIDGPATGWTVYNLAADTSANNPLHITAVPNNILYLNQDHELRGIAGIQEYGDLRMSNAGEKINPALVSFVNDGFAPSMIRYMPSLDVLLAIFDGRFGVFHYATGRFSTMDSLEMGIRLMSACEYDGEPCFGGDNGHIYHFSNSGSQDEGLPGVYTDFTSRLKSKTHRLPGEVLIKRSHLSINHVAEGEGRFEINGTVVKRFGIMAPGWYLFDALSFLADATMELYTAGTTSQVLSIKNKVRKKDFYFEVISTRGRLAVYYIDAVMSAVIG